MNSAYTAWDEPSHWSRQVLTSVPSTLLNDISRVIREAMRNAYLGDPGMLPGVRRDKYPVDRRGHFETGFHGLSAKYKNDGVVAQEVKNKTGNASHVEVTVGHIVMIGAAVESEEAIPREAAYRNSLAQTPQMALRGFDVEQTAPGDALLAVILYGPSSWYPRSFDEARPGFVTLRFPTHDWSQWVEGRIDLLARLIADEQRRQPGPEPKEEKRAE